MLERLAAVTRIGTPPRSTIESRFTAPLSASASRPWGKLSDSPSDVDNGSGPLAPPPEDTRNSWAVHQTLFTGL